MLGKLAFPVQMQCSYNITPSVILRKVFGKTVVDTLLITLNLLHVKKAIKIQLCAL